MKNIVMVSLVVLFFAGACTGGNKPPEEQSQQKKMTNRENAKKVGKFADKTLTRNLEKQLVGVIDSADEHQQELDDAAGE